jgi:hypothetical protein
MLIHEYLFNTEIFWDLAVLTDYSFLDNIVDIEEVVRNLMPFQINKTLCFIIKMSVYYIASFDNVISHHERA